MTLNTRISLMCVQVRIFDPNTHEHTVEHTVCSDFEIDPHTHEHTMNTHEIAMCVRSHTRPAHTAPPLRGRPCVCGVPKQAV